MAASVVNGRLEYQRRDGGSKSGTERFGYLILALRNGIRTVPRRFQLQFSIRAMLLLVSGLAIWLGIVAQSLQRQRAAVERICTLGGTVGYASGERYRASSQARPKQANAPNLQDAIVKWWPSKVVHVSLSDTEICDNDLKCLSSLDHLESLELNYVDISGEGLRFIQHLKRLRSLELLGSPITAESLQYLAVLKGLEHLSISGATLSSRELKALLMRLNGLRTVRVGDVEGDDGQFAALARSDFNILIVPQQAIGNSY